jgi:hypothetical protein
MNPSPRLRSGFFLFVVISAMEAPATRVEEKIFVFPFSRK